ncbi:hypothetical protein [Natronospira bacteriovora]|uniref:LemA protein n=1 Tax=Natronospira bacteriovora TaxID=3069753 RepID=A0ABU0WC22_9GAMM|nr:hypothetical protein [Natronospira sp. AB-CW4]MDQ2070485.1 hypothetical protein [Natronospira sp. AB-CW4]
MSSSAVENLVFLLIGWALSTFTALAVYLWKTNEEKRRVFSRVWRVLEDIFIDVEISKAWRQAGGIESIKALFDLDEGDFKELPPSPPTLPQDYDQVLSDVSDWEARKGAADISKSLGGISGLVQGLTQIYAGMAVYVENSRYGPVPERARSAYISQLAQLEKNLQSLFKIVDRHRQGPISRLFGAIGRWWKTNNRQ